MWYPHTELYVHLVWSTWDRAPLIAHRIKARIYAAIAAKCRTLRCQAIAVGGVSDHVHLLVRYHPTNTVSDLVRHVKGASSHLVTHVLAPDLDFKWQRSYGAFTVSATGIDTVADYIRNQEQRHKSGELWDSLERSTDHVSGDCAE